MTSCVHRTTPAAGHAEASVLDAAVEGFFDLRAMALSAVALIDTNARPEDVVRVLNQLAERAAYLAMATDDAAENGGSA